MKLFHEVDYKQRKHRIVLKGATGNVLETGLWSTIGGIAFLPLPFDVGSACIAHEEGAILLPGMRMGRFYTLREHSGTFDYSMDQEGKEYAAD